MVPPALEHSPPVLAAESVFYGLARIWKEMFAYQFVVRAEPIAAMSRKPKVVVVMPAYNAARTLHMTYAELPHNIVDLVILVDDGSSDETVQIARQLGLELFVHDRNYGYGANQKTCYREALKAGADIVVMVHPDYQYDPTLLPQIIAPIEEGKADVVLGSRLLAETWFIRECRGGSTSRIGS